MMSFFKSEKITESNEKEIDKKKMMNYYNVCHELDKNKEEKFKEGDFVEEKKIGGLICHNVVGLVLKFEEKYIDSYKKNFDLIKIQSRKDLTIATEIFNKNGKPTGFIEIIQVDSRKFTKLDSISSEPLIKFADDKPISLLNNLPKYSLVRLRKNLYDHSNSKSTTSSSSKSENYLKQFMILHFNEEKVKVIAQKQEFEKHENELTIREFKYYELCSCE